jgi:universal stress protein E
MRRTALRRLLAAVDPDAPLAAPGLADAVMESAIAMAERCSAELHVVHAWTATWEVVLRTHLPDDQVRAYVRDCRRMAGDGLWSFLDRYREHVEPRRVALVMGAPEEAIEGEVARRGIDLVVVGTTARRGLARLVIGNTAERLSGRVDADLLVVKAPSVGPRRQPALPLAVAL